MIALLLSMALATATSPQKRLEASDRSCLARMELGEIDAAREACGRLEPEGHPIAAYWRALFEKDPTRLAALLEPSRMAKLNPPGKRMLVLAGRYHFATGAKDKLAEIIQMTRKQYPRSAELDTLESLSGK